MKLVYDHQVFSWQRYGGVSRYFVELAKRVARYRDCSVTVLALVNANAYLADLGPAFVASVQIPYGTWSRLLAKLANPLAARIWMAATRPDVVHETYYAAKRFAPRRARTIVTVFDMIHEKYSQYFPEGEGTSAAKAEAVRRADHVICISENTRRDLMEILNVPASKITVVHLGHSFAAAHVESAARPVDPPYILYVGERGRYKNFAALLEAYSGSASLRKDYRLVCFGGGIFTADEEAAFEKYGVSRTMLMQTGGSDRELARFYAHAAVYVCPSLIEGFGIPILEAMAMGCPVACSETTSLPEVAGDAAEYFDPRVPGAIERSLLRILESEDRRTTLVNRGLRRARTLTWDRCAAETYSIYKRVTK